MHREIHHIAGTIFNFGVFSLNQTTFNFKKKTPLLFDSTLNKTYDDVISALFSFFPPTAVPFFYYNFFNRLLNFFKKKMSSSSPSFRRRSALLLFSNT